MNFSFYLHFFLLLGISLCGEYHGENLGFGLFSDFNLQRVSREPRKSFSILLFKYSFSRPDILCVVHIAGNSLMENIYIMELRKTLRRHEEFIQSNRIYMFLVTTKVHKNEQKQRIDILEAEYILLWKLALNLCRDSLSTTSNNKVLINCAQSKLREYETIHQLKEPMDIEHKNSPLLDVSHEETNSHHVF